MEGEEELAVEAVLEVEVVVVAVAALEEVAVTICCQFWAVGGGSGNRQ